MSAPLPTDVVDLLASFDEHEVAYVIVGAHALGAHGVPRYTGDFDVLVRPTPENAASVWRALIAFGAPMRAHGLTLDDLAREGTVYQLGLPPARIDILTSISGVDFEEAWASRQDTVVHGVSFPVIGLAVLVRNKRATGRTKDLLDIELLREAGVAIEE